jgi:recombination protein RecT
MTTKTNATTTQPQPGKELTPLQMALVDAGRSFRRLATKNTDLVFAQEKLFVLGLIEASKPGNYSLRSATPESIGSAMLQGASLGLSFNPQLGHCYLIPRRQTKGDQNSPLIVYASPGYRGLIHLAVQAEAILWCHSEIVYKQDVFRYRGTKDEPLHEYDAFDDGRVLKNAKGVYVTAKTPDGAYLTEFMSAAQVAAVRDKSEQKDGMMWTTFWTEGWRKAVIRRGQKTWPRRNQKAMERFDRAVQSLNDHEGIVLDGKAERIEDEPTLDEKQVLELHALCIDRGMESERADAWLKKLARTFKVAKIQDVPVSELETAKAKLANSVKGWKPKESV